MATWKRWITTCVLILTLAWLGIFGLDRAAAFSDSTVQNLVRVPQNAATLQDAVAMVGNGGTIELQGGTYVSSNGPVLLNNLGKSFTIQAASGQRVILAGNGSQDILRYQNTPDQANSNLIIFDGLTFSGGRTSLEGVAAGVTIHYARVEFRNCRFVDNHGTQPTTGGGGLAIGLHSQGTFTNCTFEQNSAKNEGGAMVINSRSVVDINNSTFTGNRVDLPNHRPTSAGGAVHIGNSQVSITNSTFTGNRAGYVGGAVFAIGTWADPITQPAAFVSITDSTFSNNVARPDSTIALRVPSEGGAVHFEDQSTGIIRKTTFTNNQADVGGGVNLYRAIVEIYDSTFDGNQTLSRTPGQGFGAAISAASNDGVDSTTGNGAFNRRPARLTVDRTLIIGSPANPTNAANGIYVAGDSYRQYGDAGTPQMGSLAENRATAIINNTMFYDTDVQDSGVPGTGIGGALATDLVNLTMNDVIIYGADAKGTFNASGGGMALLNQTLATLDRLVVARSTSGVFGGGIFVQGSTINLSNCILAENEVSPGMSEGVGLSFGAAIFTGPDNSPRNLSVNGTVSNCVISDNVGLPIYDDDRIDGPINDVRYNANQIFSTSFGDTVYTDSIAFQCCKTVDELNRMTVNRNGGLPSTKKSQQPNSKLSSKPNVGALVVLVDEPLARNHQPYKLGFFWSGRSATLNGVALSANSGVSTITSTQPDEVIDGKVTHRLVVGDQTITKSVEILGFGVNDVNVYLPLLKR